MRETPRPSCRASENWPFELAVGDVGDTDAGSAAGRDRRGTGSFAAAMGLASTGGGTTTGASVPGTPTVSPEATGAVGLAADAARLKSTTRRNGL
jgi:hypothetical protein